jgi:hypothetical protein
MFVDAKENQMNAKQISQAIVSGNFSNAELDVIADSIRYARAQLGRENCRALQIGSVVEWHSQRHGRRGRGTVEQIKIKNVLVREGATLWRIPANMLEVV